MTATVACLTLLSACHPQPAQPASTDSVALRIVQLERWHGGDDYARLSYPRVVGPQAARLNPVIEHWIGARCGQIGTVCRR